MKFALHSVSYAGYWPGQVRLSLEAFVAKAARLGFDGVELVTKRPHLSVLDYGKTELEQLRALLRTHNIECACLAAYTNFTGGAETPDIPFDEMQLSYVERLAEIAAALACRRIRVFTAYGRDDMSYANQRSQCVELLRECAQRSAKWGVTIGIQNHHDVAVTAMEMRTLIEEIREPNVKAFFDAWAPAVQGRNLGDEIKVIGELVDFTTVADYRQIPRFRYRPELVNYERALDAMQAVPISEGIVDYDSFFAELRSCGYDGYVAYEMCSPIAGGGDEANLDNYSRKFLTYIRQQLVQDG